LPQVSAAQELQIKAQARLASLMAEKLVMRISVLSTLLGGGKTTERLLVHISVAGRRRDQPGRGSKGKLVIRIWDRAIRGV